MFFYSIKYLERNKKKIIKFIIVGATSFLVNLIAMWICIYILKKIHLIDALAQILPIKQKDKLPEDIANIIAIEISILFNFLFSRNWTWNHIEKRHGNQLYYQCFKFHLAFMPGFVIRALLFPILSHIVKINWILNTMIGVVIAMSLNYLLYDKMVFTKKK